MKAVGKNLLWAIATFIIITIAFSLIFNLGVEKPPVLGIEEVVEKINAGEVKTITVKGNFLELVLADGSKATSRKEEETSLSETLRNYGVEAEALRNVELKIEEESGVRFWLGILVPALLPVIVLVLIFWWIFRQARTGVNQAFTFGKVNLKMFTPSRKKVTFKDVAGLREAKQELEEVVDFLKDPKKFLSIGARIPRGVLLIGPPGTGKTLLARAVAGEANVPFFHISASEFVEMFVGVGASVTGDTPVLIRDNNGTRLIPISKFVDQYYKDGESNTVKQVSGVQTLGFKPLKSGFYGSRSKDKKFFGGSKWSSVKSVYRHKADEIYEIHYLGGKISVTGDHSVFVREKNMIKTKEARDLKTGDVLVNLPFKVRSVFVPGIGTIHKIRAHDFVEETELELNLFDEKQREEAKKYSFALDNRLVMTPSAIASAIGVSQSTVKNWQLGYHKPRFLNANLFTLNTPPRVRVTPDLMKLLGYYTAEGRTTRYFTEFTFGFHEKDLHDYCSTLIRTVFNIEPSLKAIPETNSFRIRIDSPIIAEFFERHCGNGSHKKHVPEFIWDLPKKHFLAYLEGYSQGDGYTTREGKLSVTSVSQRLIRELTWLCSMHGIQVGVRQVTSPGGRVIRSKPLPETKAWNLIISKTSHPFGEKSHSLHQWKKPRVTKIIRKPYNGYVYDLCGCEDEAFFGGEKPILLHNSRVRDLFNTAKKAAPSIVFIDEIDAVGRERGAGLGGGHDEREQTLNQILVEMDGFERDTGVIVMAASNRPDILDPALLRPGRFDRRVVLDMPDINDREEILKIHTREIPLDKGVDLRVVSIRTPGFSGADLANLANEAAILAARENRKSVSQSDFLNSIEKVILGPERKSRVISKQEKEITAYHEAGHALVAASLKDADPVHKISVVSRGIAGGYTLKLPTEERRLKTKAQFLAELAVAFGGYAAEALKFKDISTGSANDIKQATLLAHKMVTQFGMSDRLGPRTFGKTHELVFLGREISTEKDYSESIAAIIDEEVNSLINKALGAAKKIVSSKIKILEAIAQALLEKETLEQEEFYKIIKSFKLKPVAIH